jgi:hypothetical protein
LTNASMMGQLERRLVQTDAHARDLYRRLTELQSSYLTTLVRLYDIIDDGSTQTALSWLDDEIERHASFHVDRMLEIAATEPVWDGVGVHVFADE